MLCAQRETVYDCTEYVLILAKIVFCLSKTIKINIVRCIIATSISDDNIHEIRNEYRNWNTVSTINPCIFTHPNKTTTYRTNLINKSHYDFELNVRRSSASSHIWQCCIREKVMLLLLRSLVKTNRCISIDVDK